MRCLRRAAALIAEFSSRRPGLFAYLCAGAVMGVGLGTGMMASGGVAAVPPAGKIWFGTSYVHTYGNLAIRGRRTFFRSHDRVAWVAHFNGPADAHHLTLSLWAERGRRKIPLFQHPTTRISNTKSTEFANRVQAQDLLVAAGARSVHLLLAYRRGRTVLASGGFSIVN